MTSDEVMTEYVMPTMEAMGGVWTETHSAYVMRRMAQEIARLRATLAVLREPSERIVDTLCEEREVETETDRCYIVGILRAAVAAAEQEVAHDPR